jgi:hypothetical protein
MLNLSKQLKSYIQEQLATHNTPCNQYLKFAPRILNILQSQSASFYALTQALSRFNVFCDSSS